MDTHTTALVVTGLVGLFAGLIVAEALYKKAAKPDNVAPAIMLRNARHIVQQKKAYYGMLAFFVISQASLGVSVPSECYTLVVCAIVGGDLQKIIMAKIRFK